MGNTRLYVSSKTQRRKWQQVSGMRARPRPACQPHPCPGTCLWVGGERKGKSSKMLIASSLLGAAAGGQGLAGNYRPCQHPRTERPDPFAIRRQAPLPSITPLTLTAHKEAQADLGAAPAPSPPCKMPCRSPAARLHGLQQAWGGGGCRSPRGATAQRGRAMGLRPGRLLLLNRHREQHGKERQSVRK